MLSKNVTNRLEIRERADIGVYVKDLSKFSVKNPEDMDRLMAIGNKNSMVTKIYTHAMSVQQTLVDRISISFDGASGFAQTTPSSHVLNLLKENTAYTHRNHNTLGKKNHMISEGNCAYTFQDHLQPPT